MKINFYGFIFGRNKSSNSLEKEKDIVLITGANGMLSKKLANLLHPDYEMRFLTRKAQNPNEYQWDIDKQYLDVKSLIRVKHIVHLAGVSIAEGCWTATQRQRIINSRVQSAKLLLEKLKNEDIKLKSFISASAVGFYGTKTTNNIYKEDAPCGNDFLSRVCSQWEQAADAFREVATQVTKLRFGVILSKEGGALPKMLHPINLGLGAVLGNGKQYVPWVAINDVCRFVKYAIENSLEGTYNVVASESVTHQEMTHLLAKHLGKKIYLPNIPAFLVKWIFGDASVLLLEGSRVSNEKIKQTGFVFEFESLNTFLEKELKLKEK
ncbi:TIGR01777 family oxidoreductase [Capnocytophaga felis]|uniref:NAD-dependent epimerase n=1 Tax=Capnocytophaga felis TaxID=2267611 RepID=A0A5M4B9S1_9FLAO|nr:TIGR01777 family oxidoreductase [Capnocytophaga felis]GET46351.1 NAD-dependent epimerase [Capnocytophaga felis]GET48181.1 NAD-dependent epimerase [Capnocytophaga felis]